VKSLRFLIWTYFWLLILEGALRKWIFPGYSNVLLLVRDPVVIIMYLRAIYLGIFPRNRWMYALIVIAFVFGILGWVQLVAGAPLAPLGIVGTLKTSVVIFGWRTYFLHLPLIFLFPIIIRRQDLRSFVRAVTILSIPMTVLVVFQYLATGDSWINVAAQGGEQLAFVGDKIRAPGTFSFATGPACFYALLAACGASALLGDPKLARWMGWVAVLGAVIYAPIAGGRLNAGMVLFVLAIGILLASLQRGWGQIKILLVTAAMVLAVTYTPIFREGMENTNIRLDGAADFENGAYEHGFFSRILSGFTVPVDLLREGQPLFLGEGLGLGTIGGAKLQTGEAQFLIGESEWARIIVECGWAWGMLYVIWRVSLAVWLLGLSWRAMRRGHPLALLLWGANIWTLLQGQWGQPTNLGFAVLIAGLTLAACQDERAAEPYLGFAAATAQFPTFSERVRTPSNRMPQLRH